MNSDEGDLFDDDSNLENAFGNASQSHYAFSQVQNVASHQNRLMSDDDDDEVQTVKELDFRQGLARVRHTEQTQSSKRSTIDPIRGEPVAAASQLDKVLFKFGVERRINENNKEFYAIRGSDMNYEKLVKAIDREFGKNPTKVDEFMEMLRSAISIDDRFKLFVLPTVSYIGEEDTLFRALITAKSTQIAAFKLLVFKLSCFADREATTHSISAKEMALACLSHLRAVRYLYDGRELFEAVFECAIDKWSGVLRREFVLLLPDCFPDLGLQQECLLNLTDFFIKGFETDSFDARKALMESMRQLSAGNQVRQTLRIRLLEVALSMEPEIVCGIISLCVEWARLDDPKGLTKALSQIRERVIFEDLFQKCTDRNSYELCFDSVAHCLTKVANSIYISGSKAVKATVKFLQMNDEEAIGTQQDDEETPEKVQKKFNMFDTLLCFAMLNAPNVDDGIMVSLRSEIVNQPTFLDTVKSLAAEVKFHDKFFSSVMYAAKHLLPNNNHRVSAVGAILYKNLLIHNEHRTNTISQMLNHMSVSASESTAIVNVLSEVANYDGDLLIPLLPRLLRFIDHFSTLTTSNVRCVFEVLLKVSIVKERTCDYKNEVTPLLEQYLSAINSKEKHWGVLGLLVHLDIYLSNTIGMPESEREKGIFARLKIAQSRTDQSPSMKAEFYRNFAAGLRANRKIVRSKYIIEWTDILLKTFEKQFIKKRSNLPASQSNSTTISPNSDNWIHVSALMKSGQAVELIPYLELLNELCVCQERWSSSSTGTVILAKLKGVLETNFFLDDVSGDEGKLTDYCDSLFFVIEFLRLSLNVFAFSARCEEQKDKVWNRLELLIKFQNELIRKVKKLGQYRLPNVTWSIEREDMNLTVTHKVVVPKTGGRKRKQPEEENLSTTVLGENDAVGSSERILSEARTPSRPKIKLPKDPCTKNVQVDEMIAKYIRPLSLKAIVDLIEFLCPPKDWTFFLLTEFRKNYNLLMPNKVKTSVPWETNKVDLPGEQFDITPDSRTLWKLIYRFLRTFFKIMNGSSDQLERMQHETCSGEQPESMGNTFLLCLELLRDFFLKKDVVLRGNQKNAEDNERRRDELMSKIVFAIDDAEEVSIGSNNSELMDQSDQCRIIGYLLKRSDVRYIESSCVLLELFDLLPSNSSSDRMQIVRFAWNCLMKDWSDGAELKGAAFQKQLGCILEKCILFGKESDRLGTLCVFITKLLAAIIPDKDKGAYKMPLPESSSETFDSVFPSSESSTSAMDCVNVNKSSFPILFKVAFQILNQVASSKHTKTLKDDDRLPQWACAALCFRALAVFIRAKNLRSITVLSTALREGRRFLNIFCQSSNTFVKMFDRPVTDGKFIDDVLLVLKNVQIGNRALQCVGVDAKEKKMVSLCTLIPDLRAANEMFVRQMRSIFEYVGCGEAFSIGILKSRNMDGNEIVREARSPARTTLSPDPEPMSSCPFHSDEEV